MASNEISGRPDGSYANDADVSLGACSASVIDSVSTMPLTLPQISAFTTMKTPMAKTWNAFALSFLATLGICFAASMKF